MQDLELQKHIRTWSWEIFSKLVKLPFKCSSEGRRSQTSTLESSLPVASTWASFDTEAQQVPTFSLNILYRQVEGRGEGPESRTALSITCDENKCKILLRDGRSQRLVRWQLTRSKTNQKLGFRTLSLSSLTVLFILASASASSSFSLISSLETLTWLVDSI